MPNKKHIKCHQAGLPDAGSRPHRQLRSCFDLSWGLSGKLRQNLLVHRDTLVVHVKSFEGEIHNTRAIDDIRRAFQRNEHANQGLVVSTGTTPGENFRGELDKLQEDTGKPVALLTGSEFAAFFLKFGGDLLNLGAQTK